MEKYFEDWEYLYLPLNTIDSLKISQSLISRDLYMFDEIEWI